MGNDDIIKKTEEGMRESNKVLIRELIRDLEEKGISPVWAIEGEIKKLKVISEDEFKNFNDELAKYGLSKSDFCLLEDDKKNDDQENSRVILIHKKTAKLKTYKAGSGDHWVDEFHRDLENNFFNN
jgi:hypothetical protein